MLQKEQSVLNHFLSDTFNEILKIEEKAIENSQFPDLSLREIHVLETVLKLEETAENTAARIASCLNITPGTLTSSVNVLAKKGYLSKNKDEIDKRIVRICVTQKGRDAQKMHEKFHDDMVSDILHELSEEEAKVLSGSLEKLVAFFQNKKKLMWRKPMIRIITDSLSDLTMERAKELNIDILPLTVNFGDESYKCGIELTNEQFYEKLENNPNNPSSAAVNPFEFEEIFQRYVDAGDEIVAILFSKHMSATYQSASIAADTIDSDSIHLIDCENGAMGQALLIETAVELRDKGLSASEIVEKITDLLPRTKTFIVVDTLEYLKRGGRVSKSAAFIGNLIKLHPVLQVVADGAKPVDKVKGKKSCNAWLLNKLQECPADPSYKIVIGHSNSLDRAEAFKEQLKEAGIENEIFITCIGPVVGTHIGPNCLGIGYVEK